MAWLQLRITKITSHLFSSLNWYQWWRQLTWRPTYLINLSRNPFTKLGRFRFPIYFFIFAKRASFLRQAIKWLGSTTVLYFKFRSNVLVFLELTQKISQEPDQGLIPELKQFLVSGIRTHDSYELVRSKPSSQNLTTGNSVFLIRSNKSKKLNIKVFLLGVFLIRGHRLGLSIVRAC